MHSSLPKNFYWKIFVFKFNKCFDHFIFKKNISVILSFSFYDDHSTYTWLTYALDLVSRPFDVGFLLCFLLWWESEDSQNEDPTLLVHCLY